MVLQSFDIPGDCARQLSKCFHARSHVCAKDSTVLTGFGGKDSFNSIDPDRAGLD